MILVPFESAFHALSNDTKNAKIGQVWISEAASKLFLRVIVCVCPDFTRFKRFEMIQKSLKSDTY